MFHFGLVDHRYLAQLNKEECSTTREAVCGCCPQIRTLAVKGPCSKPNFHEPERRWLEMRRLRQECPPARISGRHGLNISGGDTNRACEFESACWRLAANLQCPCNISYFVLSGSWVRAVAQSGSTKDDR